MDVAQVRRAFLDHLARQGHVAVPRAPLVPHDDPTTLFTGSGMQPLLPYLLGADHPAGTRLADSQPCLRSQDIPEVGDNRHTTFFEMLGSWSLGDYGKEHQLRQVWAFLTEWVRLDPARIFVTCHLGDPRFGIPRDEESAGIWAGLFAAAGLSSDLVDLGSEEDASHRGSHGARISLYGAKNWWCRGGTTESMPVGEPGGPDSEVFYLYPDNEHDPSYGEHCHPNCDCGRYVEIGNSVFMEYRRTETGFEPLPRRNVDFGGGLERLTAAAIDTDDVFRVSTLWPVVVRLQELSGLRYDDHQVSMRVVADHVRGATFLAVDGVRPGNKAEGYVLRRLVRRAVRFGLDLGLDQDFLEALVPVVAAMYAEDFPEVGEHRARVVALLVREEKAFRRTLATGLRRLRACAAEHRDAPLGGDELFTLYDTFGFPVELSTEEAGRAGIALVPGWRAEFDGRMAAQRARSQQARTRVG